MSPICTLARLLALPVVLCSFLGAGASAASGRDAFTTARHRLVDKVLIPAGISNERVIEAMKSIPRHEFVSINERRRAYFDISLPIGEQQTISSPFIVAYMTESLDPQPTDRVLEIGTGSGYQAAVLSPLVKDVYTIEIVQELGRKATRTLRRLGYRNVHVRTGDGYQGWPGRAPFDKIIVTCSPEKVPRPLVEQLAEGGRLVVPVGERYQQTLYLFTKKDGKLEAEPLRPTLFVPMTGRAEAHREVKPDPLNPTAVNGNFEAPLGEDEHLAGWYYQRLASLVEDEQSPEGTHYALLENDEPGRVARLLQGFAIDGREVQKLEISAWVKCENVIRGRTTKEVPIIAVTFYDETRRDLGQAWLGPFLHQNEWAKTKKTIRVPVQAREGILRVSMFGATGKFSVDDVRMKGWKP